MAAVVVFTDTNLGTHLAIAVPPDITAGDFKSEFERSHFDCFPKFGDIKVSGLMVKGKSRFYHLPNSMPIKHAFHNSQRQWFLHIEAKPLTGLFNYSAAEVGINNCDTGNLANSLEPKKCITSADNNIMKCKGRRRKVSRLRCLKGVIQQLLRIVYISNKKKEIKKKKEKIGKRKKFPRKRLTRNHVIDCTERGIENGNGSKNEDTFSERLSDEVSVTGIIRRYFTNLNEVSPSSSDVTSKTIKKQAEEPFDYHPKTPSRIVSPSTAFKRGNLEKFDIGNRLVNASTNLVVSVKPWPAFSLCRFKVPNSSSPVVRSLSVFEISDNDD